MNKFHPPDLSIDTPAHIALLHIDWSEIESQAAALLSRYIQFDTTNPPGNEIAAIEFLADVLREQGFEPTIIQTAPGRANLIARLHTPNGDQTPPCLLYSHADVVPAEAATWSVPPFEGRIQDGFVWGRGALDSKGLGVIFLQALILLKQVAPRLKRDIILLIAADEETSGHFGVAWLLDHHPDLIKAEYVWDEGGIGFCRSVGGPPLFEIAVAEKGSLTVRLVAYGTSSHASIPHADNPQDRLVRALSRVSAWRHPARLTEPVIKMLQTLANSQPFPRSFFYARAHQPLWWPFLQTILKNDPIFAPLIHNTASLTMLRGGQISNVIPAQAEAKLDIRLLPGEDPQAVLASLRSTIADSKVAVEVEELPVPHPATPTDTGFYRALVQTLQALAPSGLVTPSMTPGTTDSRFFRRAGMKAYGFMPMLLDIPELSRIHSIDERVSTANLRWGIQVVVETLLRL
jgi:acetylornithine deacetylase/succinyl-diaminopimelate desuccinylase-like protein